MPSLQICDPAVTTRQAWTDNLTNTTIPSNAKPVYRKLATGLQEVMRLMIAHPAMSQNKSQTFNTPANSKNEVYFMWDFVQRTLGVLLQLDPTLPLREFEMWKEIKGRAVYGDMLIQDDTGLVRGMTEKGYVVTYGRKKADEMLDCGKEFGEEIRKASREAVEAWEEQSKVMKEVGPGAVEDFNSKLGQ